MRPKNLVDPHVHNYKIAAAFTSRVKWLYGDFIKLRVHVMSRRMFPENC